MQERKVKYVALNEIGTTAFGWFLFFSGYLLLSVAVIAIMLRFKNPVNWIDVLRVFLKWEILLIVLAFSIANVVHFFKNYLQRFLPIRGFLRTFILYFIAYVFATLVVPYLLIFLPFAQVKIDELESSLAFVLIIAFVLRVLPQKNYDDPKGPILKLPIQKWSKDALKPFGFFSNGADFVQEWGTPVYAACDGKVTVAWPYKGYGNMVKINHLDGFSTVYSQLGIISVKYGQEVKTGELIGYVGNTGDSYEPHLHFEVRYRNRVVDPGAYVLELRKDEEKSKGEGYNLKSKTKKKSK